MVGSDKRPAAPGGIAESNAVQAMQLAHQELRTARDRGAAPGALLRLLADAFDGLIRGLFAGCAAAEAPLSLVALGGYGRHEVFPYSDLDLLILHEGVADAVITALVEGVVYPLWDARVSVTHTVRSIEQTLDLAATDLTVRTALLDARLLAGDEGPYHALSAGAYREFFGPQRVNEFVDALVEERSARHARFGESVYLLEPNVKSNKGGLRDVNTALWAAKARYGIPELAHFAEVGAATPRQVIALAEAHDFFRGLRLAMHLEAGRAQDQLLFELQERLAPQLFPDDAIPGLRRRTTQAVAPAVERLMHAFYRHARTVIVETEGILERCQVPEARAAPPPVDPIDSRFVAVGPWLSCPTPQCFWDEPPELLRAFEIALDRGLRIDRPTRDAMAEAVAGEPGAQLAAEPLAAQRFVAMLARSDSGDTLRAMHDIGLIAAVVPEFEPCTGRVQHDLYHVYTVDQHTLYVIGALHAIRRGEPLAYCQHALTAMAQIPEPVTLYLAALLHDVAKPLGSGHARKGARLAAGVAARLGLSAADQDEVVFLVREHLLMSHLAQRRDLADPQVIGGFADMIGSVDRLSRLYLLTVADSAMTRPANLTDWKGSLLDDLYERTRRKLESEPATVDDLAAEARRRRAQLGSVLQPEWGEAGQRLVECLPRRLLLSSPAVHDLLHPLTVALERERAPESVVGVGIRAHDSSSSTEVTVACADAPGLLATMTGVMLASRLEVLAAQVYTLQQRDDPAAPGRALDIFWVRPPAVAAAGELWAAFRRTLEAALRGEISVDELVQSHIRPSALPPRVVPAVSTKIHFDNQASRNFTILELQAPDRPGVLHVVTRTLSGLGLEIRLAMISTESGRVVDSFYVQDRATGDKIADSARQNTIAQRLVQAVESLASEHRV